MTRSTTTIPAIDPALAQFALEQAKALETPPPATGYLGAMGRGAVRAPFSWLGAVTDVLGNMGNPTYGAMDQMLRMAGAQPQNPLTQFGNTLADKVAPPPTGTGPRLAEAGTEGAVQGAMGPMPGLGMLSGAAGGVTGQGAMDMGLPAPIASLLGMAAGAGVGKVAQMRANRGPMGAATELDQLAAMDDRSLGQALNAVPDQPGTGQLGIERMGRTGTSAAIEVARQGGAPADALVAALADQGDEAGTRVLQSVSQAFRTSPRDPNAALRVIRQQVRAADQRNYTPEMLSREIPVNEDLAFLLDDPVIQKAYNDRMDVSRTRVSGAAGKTTNDPLQPLFEPDIDPATGEVLGFRVPDRLTIRQINEVKKGLDGIAQSIRDGQQITSATGKPITAEAAAAAGTRLERIRAYLTDPSRPTYQADYANALREHGDIASRADLVRMGWQGFGPTIRVGPGKTVAATPEELGRIATEAGPNRRYLLLAMLERVRTKGTNLSPEDVRRIEAVLPPGQKVGDVLATLTREGERGVTRSAVEAAARRVQKPTSPDAERGMADVAVGRGRWGMREFLLGVIRREGRRIPQPVRQRVSDLLSTPAGPQYDAKAQALLTDLATLGIMVPRAAMAGAVAADATRGRPE